jgi:hypothetical protein
MLMFPITTLASSLSSSIGSFHIAGSNNQTWPRTVRRLLPMDTSAGVTTERIKALLYQCDKEHALCSTGSPQQLPRRILEITDSKVILREHVTGRHRYACLSHCWGREGPVVKTTHSTINYHKAGIPINDLSKTFRESAQLCIHLGLRFLWIDALCKLLIRSYNSRVAHQNRYNTGRRS